MRITAKEALLVLLTFALALVLGLAWQRRQPKDRLTDAVLVGGSNGYAALHYPDRVLAYRIDHPGDVRGFRNDFPVTAGPISVPPALCNEFRAALKSRELLGTKGCSPDYGVQIDFVKGRHTLRLGICLHCASIAAFLDGKRCESLHDNRYLDFDQAQVTKVVKGLFPNDPAIQELND